MFLCLDTLKPKDFQPSFKSQSCNFKATVFFERSCKRSWLSDWFCKVIREKLRSYAKLRRIILYICARTCEAIGVACVSLRSSYYFINKISRLEATKAATLRLRSFVCQCERGFALKKVIKYWGFIHG